MKFNEFVKTVQEAGDVKDTLSNIAEKLLESVGLGNYATDTIASFAKGRRQPFLREMPKNVDGFIQYFRDKTRSTWKDMQRAFAEKDEYGFINRDTIDAEIFYRSLLALFFDILRFTPTSLRHILPAEPLLFGREDELKQIEDAFKEKNYVVLTGIGGIGKSQTALAYAHKMNKSGGWIIQHVLCEETDTLQSAVNKLQIDDSNEQEIFDYKLQVLKNSLKPTLVILDNFYGTFEVEDSNDFAKLKECGHHVQFLITSRDNLVWEKGRVIDIPPLGDNALLELYAYHRFDDSYDHSGYITEHTDVIKKIFALAGNHTLTITLLARLVKNTLWKEQKVYDLLESGLKFPEIKDHITKDGTDIEGNIEEITKKIFDISLLAGTKKDISADAKKDKLADARKDIMKYMSIMPLMGIEYELFEKLTGHSSKEINDLVNSHWIMKDPEEQTIRLHPVISDTMLSLFNGKEDNTAFFKKVSAMRDRCIPGSPRWHMLNKIPDRYALKILLRGYPKAITANELRFIYMALESYANSNLQEGNELIARAAERQQNRALKKIYTFLFGDCLHVSIPEGKNTMDYTVYLLLGYDVNGSKDILGIWLSKSEDKYYWEKVFCDIKTRGVEDILFISGSNIPGLEDAAKSIYKDVVVQPSIVHLIRNSSKCIPDEDCCSFTARLKKVYGASSIEAAELEFERFKQKWSYYPEAVNAWSHSWACVEHLFNYGSAVRRVLCATDWSEDVYSSFCNVMEKGSFPNEDAIRASLRLQNIMLAKKWNKRRFYNWALVRNELALDKKMQERIMKYAEH